MVIREWVYPKNLRENELDAQCRQVDCESAKICIINLIYSHNSITHGELVHFLNRFLHNIITLCFDTFQTAHIFSQRDIFRDWKILQETYIYIKSCRKKFLLWIEIYILLKNVNCKLRTIRFHCRKSFICTLNLIKFLRRLKSIKK